MRLDSPREEEASLVLLLLVLLLLKTDVWFRFEYTELNRPFGSIAAADDCPLTLVQSRTVRTVKRARERGNTARHIRVMRRDKSSPITRYITSFFSHNPFGAPCVVRNNPVSCPVNRIPSLRNCLHALYAKNRPQRSAVRVNLCISATKSAFDGAGARTN